MPVIDGSAGEERDFPTDWHMFDGMARVEVRQINADIYEIKWPEGSMKLDAEGWNLYREGGVKFSTWCINNGYLLEPPS